MGEIVGEFAITEELIVTTESETIQSVFSFAYFGYADGNLGDARFDADLSNDDLTTLFEAFDIKVYTGTRRGLVSFDDLQKVVMTTLVLVEDYEVIQEAIKAAWVKVDASFSEVELTILRQEEYLSVEGLVYYVLLYSVQVEGRLISASELKPLPVETLLEAWAEIEELSVYTMAEVTVEQLKRFSLAVTFACQKWVSREQRKDVLEAIKETLEDLPRTTTVEYAAQVIYLI